MMSPDCLRLYLVLDPGLCGGAAGMVSTALAAARAGVTAVQLRAPSWKKRQMVECGRELMRVLAPTGVPLIVDDHLDVALAVGAHGLHVGQADLSPEDCRALMPRNMILGLSVTNEAEALAADPALVDYVGAGPVFGTPTKPDAAPAVGIDGLRRIVLASRCPGVAIGGIKAGHIRDIMNTGIDGVAVVSAVCGQPDPALSVKNLLGAF